MPGRTCRTCGAKIIWAVTDKGHNIPIDPTPRPDGNLMLCEDGAVLLAIPVCEGDNPTERYVSHFASCPDAAVHRRTVRKRVAK